MIPAVIAGALLLVALGELPYGYYTFMRWALTASAIWMIVAASRSVSRWTAVPLTMLAILFNPIVPVYLQRDIWVLIDIFAAIVFVVLGAVIRPARADAHAQ